jgi:hypothetical protein
MARNIILWILALLITLASARYQRKTGPTHSVDGEKAFAGTMLTWSFDRSHDTGADQPVTMKAPNNAVTGTVFFKRYKTADAWTPLPMKREGDILTADLPQQPAAGKLEYYVEAAANGQTLRLDVNGTSVITRFKGHVPKAVLYPHILFMFFAMFLSSRAGLEALFSNGKPRTQVIWTVVCLFIGGMILGPLVQKYAFGVLWSGVPFGWDLTDNKTLIALIGWVLALALVWNKEAFNAKPVRRWMVVIASVVMMAVYLIPHSALGSELDYNKLDKEKQAQQK